MLLTRKSLCYSWDTDRTSGIFVGLAGPRSLRQLPSEVVFRHLRDYRERRRHFPATSAADSPADTMFLGLPDYYRTISRRSMKCPVLSMADQLTGSSPADTEIWSQERSFGLGLRCFN